MREMPDRDAVLLIDVGEEGTLVVDTEVEDAVLVGQAEGGCEEGRVGRGGGGEGGFGGGEEGQAVVGGEHCELELQGVGGGWVVRRVVVDNVFGEFDGVGLVFWVLAV